MSLAAVVAALLEGKGRAAYYGEAVTQAEHALQAAHFARRAGAQDALVLAALLHDIGHLVVEVPDDIADWTTDARHEETGAQWLARHFGPEVCEPVRLHVAAKRYLCATDPAYRARLSVASVHTLALQGGPMDADGCARFEASPWHRDAVRLRFFDETAKVAGLATEPFAAYAPLLARLARPGSDAG